MTESLLNAYNMNYFKSNSSSAVISTFSSNSTFAADRNCRLIEDDTPSIKGVKILAYSAVLIISLLGNSIIIKTVVRNKSMQTTINYLITNMAASDLLVSICAVPIKLSETVLGPRGWSINGTLGLISCKLSYFLQEISTAVSILSLVVIAIDRYGGIVYPFRPTIVTRKRCKIIIPLVWLLSMCLDGVYFHMSRLTSHNDTTQCNIDWTSYFNDPRKAQEQYVLVTFIFLILLPFPILTVLYCRIIWILRKESGATGILTRILRKRHEENTKVIKNILVIMVVFAFCYLPVCTYGMLYFFVWKWEMPCNMEQLGFAAIFILHCNAALTPLINFVFNDRYRKGLKDFLRVLHLWPKDNNTEEIELKHLQPKYCE